MQLIFITRSGRNFLSLNLSGWRLAIAMLLVCGLIICAIWAGIAFGSFRGSLTDRLVHIWHVSRSDSVATEIGQLKAKVEMLESSMMTIQDGGDRSHDLHTSKRLSSEETHPVDRLKDLQIRAQKMAMALNNYSTGIQRALASKTNSAVVMPVDNAPISSSFGWRQDPITGERAFHSGVDWISPVGTPVFAAGNGVVIFIGPASAFGNMVEVRHGEHIVARYAHLQGIEVTTGMPVVAGQRIARVGSTGRSTGSHLHFEWLVDGNKVDPEPFLSKNKPRLVNQQQPASCCAPASIL
ncbi:MAG: M23 family metallopeptidase [Limnohabitans sp.]